MRASLLLVFLLVACEPVPSIRFVDETADTGDGGKDAGTEEDDDGGWPLASVEADAAVESCTLTADLGDPRCNGCMAAMPQGCCAEVDACVANKPCTKYLACLRQCLRGNKKPKSCMKSCAKDVPNGAASGERVAACVPSSCRSTCIE